ncbi:delta-1-pyrroline-5-carboxylate dehydrogenase, mitochondrial isoform X1 [Coccinella septempunctata]|uniref:delta-1-pyrroline-5-carboxylate dehydrogenase, mitochondrial isoform X1 n=1 Tax=Coccinella septempunctata TaxID=41139 RepID=UPI001D07A645|nr:delta-1-pyrroline-5-carboxylate dehydrogenase, mitochondrial isoform X1 [Coccinella septempunctata]
MLSILKQTSASTTNLQRALCKCYASVVQLDKIPDFPVKNEPVLGYLKNSPERKQLEDAIKQLSSQVEDVPLVIGDKEYRTEDVRYQVMPHNHKHKIAKFYYANKELLNKAIQVATETQKKWDRVPIAERIKIWDRAATMMSKEWRARLNAATMLGQSKTMVQAEIDSAAELIDFFRFNSFFFKEAIKYQPISENPKETLNSMRYRGVDGFMAAVAPFNFTAIGGNLAYTPALAGNAVLWKPSDTALLSNWQIFKICREAGVPAGVVNFVPADGPVFGDTITASPYFAGLNFTGSVPTFQRLWNQVGQNLNKYINFPRLIGECGGKNYHFVHSSADVVSVVNGTIRSAFEYCGQKCSACARMYVPESLWPKIKEGLIAERNKLKIGDPTEADSFMGAVIDARAYDRISGYINHAKTSKNLSIIAGGKCDNSVGYFIEPTIVQSTDPRDKIMTEEIFGPVLAVYVYKDGKEDEIMGLIESSTQFALTGAVFAKDVAFQKKALDALRITAGNFYINDKSTGSVVGQQPFGGARMSGTNDKAGGPHYVLRFANPQAIKETFQPLKDITYPYMRE